MKRFDCNCGENCRFGSGVVIGSAGFTFTREESGSYTRKDNLLFVTIEDNVEIGVNSTVDSGCVIGNGTKIDSLVHIGHDCVIGKNCLIMAGVVLGGYVTIGDNSKVCMNATVKNRVVIGPNCFVGMGVNLIDDLPEGCKITVNGKYGKID